MPSTPRPKPQPAVTVRLGRATISIPLDAAMGLLNSPHAQRVLRTQITREDGK